MNLFSEREFTTTESKTFGEESGVLEVSNWAAMGVCRQRFHAIWTKCSSGNCPTVMSNMESSMVGGMNKLELRLERWNRHQDIYVNTIKNNGQSRPGSIYLVFLVIGQWNSRAHLSYLINSKTFNASGSIGSSGIPKRINHSQSKQLSLIYLFQSKIIRNSLVLPCLLSYHPISTV